MANSDNIGLLIEKGLITSEQLGQAKAQAQKIGISLERALEKLGFISEIDISTVVAESIKGRVPFSICKNKPYDVKANNDTKNQNIFVFQFQLLTTTSPFFPFLRFLLQ